MSRGKPDREGKPPMVFFEPKAWATGCARLTPMQEWVYLQISVACMDTGRPVPEDEIDFLMLRYPDYRRDLDALISKGKVEHREGKGYWVQRAIDEQRVAARHLEKKRKNAQKAAEARWGKPEQDQDDICDRNADAHATAMPVEKRREEKTSPNGDDSPHSPPKKKPPAKPKIELPEDIDPDLWKAYLEHRRKVKAPMTERAQELAIMKLAKINRETGQPKNAIIEQSIERGWKGLFEIKNDGKGKSGWGWINE